MKKKNGMMADVWTVANSWKCPWPWNCLNDFYYSLLYTEVKKTGKMLLPLLARAQCWRKKLANFIIALSNLDQ